MIDIMLNRNEPEWLQKFRMESFQKFQQLPIENSEIFKKNSLFNDFDFTFTQTSQQKNYILTDELKNKGIIFKPIMDAIQTEKILLNTFTNKDEDKFSNFTNAFFDSGFFLYIPENTIIKNPFQIIDTSDGQNISKNIIIVENNSKLDIVEEIYSNNNKIHFNNLDLIVRENSEISFSSVQAFDKNTIHITNKNAHCMQDSKLYWNIGLFGGMKTRSRTNNFLIGDGAFVEDLEIAFGNGEQKFDMYSTLNHTGRSTSGKVFNKNLLKNSAHAIFKGMIKIEKDAVNSNSYLASHNLLLDRDAKAYAIPGLEIETNEVKATHSASVSPIDPEKIFYLMSRGLDNENARKLISLGFLDPVLERMLLPEVKMKLVELLELKWVNQDDKFESLKQIEIDKAHDRKHESDIFESHYKYR